MSLSSLLVQREVATIRQVEEALARQVIYGGDLVTNLLEVARVDEAKLCMLIAESHGIAAAPGGHLPLPSEHVKGLVPRELALKLGALPLAIEGDRLVVAVPEPLPSEALDELRAAAGMSIEQRFALHVRVREALSKVHGQIVERRIQRVLARMATGLPLSLAPISEPIPGSTAVTSPPPGDPAEAQRRTAMPPPGSPAVPAPGAQSPLGAPAPRVAASSPFAQSPSAPIPAIQPGTGRRATAMGFPAPALPVGAGAAAAAGTAGIMRREQGPARPPRRRRGPMTFEMATRELDNVESKDALLDLLFDFARQYFDYLALFVVQGDIAEGREAHGPGASRDRVATIGVPLDLPSLFASARELRAPVLALPARDGLDAVLLADLVRPTTATVVVVPVSVRGRAVALLYADNGEAGVEADAASDVLAFAAAVGPSLEQLILRKKLKGAGAAPPAKSAARRAGAAARGAGAAALAGLAERPHLELDDLTERPPPMSDAPPESPRELAQSAPPVAYADTSPTDRPLAPERASLFPQHASEPSFSRPSRPPAQRNSAPPAPPYAGHAPESPVPPPPPTAALVRRPVGPPIPREEPPDSGERKAASDASDASDVSARALLDDLTRSPDSDPGPKSPRASSSSPPSDMAIAIPARRPPSSLSEPPAVLPSVIIDGDEENLELVETLVARGGDEALEQELVHRGHHAMPALMLHFPGPILADRARTGDAALRIADAGPIVRVIAAQRRVALPFVLGSLDHADTDRRFWATFLITELPYAEAIPALLPRLHDDDPRVRRAAKQAVRAVNRTSHAALVAALSRIASDQTVASERRIAMIDTLVDVRAAASVPVLIDILKDGARNVGVAACNGLAIVTRQDFVLDADAWRTWWAANGKRNRLEWLIDALVHESADMRRDAAAELRLITKEYFGYSEDLPDRERARAQQRWRDWWLTEGRLRFAEE